MTDERVSRGMSAQLELRRRMVAQGARPIGWKVGLNPPAVHEQLGLDGPLVGFLTDATLVTSGASWKLPRGDANVVVEPEVGIEIGGDGESIAALMPALEVAEFDRPLEDVEDVLAIDLFHSAVVLGPRTAVAAPGQAAAPGTGRLLHNGETAHELDASAALDGIIEVVKRRLGDAGERLTAGDVIIAGALAKPVPVRAGDRVRIDLDPLGAAEIAFA